MSPATTDIERSMRLGESSLVRSAVVKMLDSADDCFESPSFAIASRSRSICLRVAGDESAIAARQSAWMIEKCSICRPIMLLRKTSYMMHIGTQMMRLKIIYCYENHIW